MCSIIMQNNDSFSHSIDVDKVSQPHSISEDELNQIYSWFDELYMKAPSAEYVTFSLFSLLHMPQCTVFDLGCGCGPATLVLAKAGATVHAMDVYAPGLELLQSYARREGADSRITTSCLSMDAVSEILERCGQADVIWCEGAIYNIGFENGLRLWRSLLKEKGWVVVSETCWLTNSPPKEIKTFWDVCYPDVCSISECVQIGEQCGYQCHGTFVLPSSAWEAFYAPQRLMLEKHRALHRENKESAFSPSFLDEIEQEIHMFDKYYDAYSYVFFLFRIP